MSWTPDRRPIKLVRAYNGSPTNPRGLAVGWQSAVDYQTSLFGAFDAGYALGFRRFTIHAPAGRPVGQVGYGLHHWRYLPADVRAMLTWELPAWLDAHSDAVVIPYLSFTLNQSGRFHCDIVDGLVPDEAPVDTTRPFLDAVEPWLALSPQPGQIGIGFDASTSPERARHLYGWAEYFRTRGIWIMGEAIPDLVGVGVATPLFPSFDMPVWANYSYLSHHLRPLRQTWTFDPTITEAIIGFQNGDLTSAADAQPWVDRGYVLSSWANSNDSFVLEAAGVI